jgi:hypothetical protein
MESKLKKEEKKDDFQSLFQGKYSLFKTDFNRI